MSAKGGAACRPMRVEYEPDHIVVRPTPPSRAYWRVCWSMPRAERLTPSHAVKKGRRYRYYVSAALIAEAGADRAQG
jgi:hypothetical protein